jgi:hypothetical protein
MTERARVNFGPWVRELAQAERAAQFRSLAALVAAFTGSSNPLVAALRAAEHDKAAAETARDLLEDMPTRTKRNILATFGAITWPARSNHFSRRSST